VVLKGKMLCSIVAIVSYGSIDEVKLDRQNSVLFYFFITQVVDLLNKLKAKSRAAQKIPLKNGISLSDC
jgi:hypothetical protein